MTVSSSEKQSMLCKEKAFWQEEQNGVSSSLLHTFSGKQFSPLPRGRRHHWLDCYSSLKKLPHSPFWKKKKIALLGFLSKGAVSLQWIQTAEASRKLHWHFQTVPGSAYNWVMFSDITLPLHCIREIGDCLKVLSRVSNRRNYYCSLWLMEKAT